MNEKTICETILSELSAAELSCALEPGPWSEQYQQELADLPHCFHRQAV